MSLFKTTIVIWSDIDALVTLPAMRRMVNPIAPSERP